MIQMTRKLTETEIAQKYLAEMSKKITCPRCDIPMILGKAIKPEEEYNCRYLVQQEPINSDTLEIIDVMKCPKCGHSETKE
jgi:ssDNA-binding Zn-finger/Zn-ribbon topoisomerase 1